MKLEKGQIIEGEITRIVEEAVFVDVGANRQAVIPKIDVDQVDESPIVSLEVGETVPVYIYHAPENGGNPLGSIAEALGIPPRTSRSPASTDPWATFEDKYQVGDVVEGTVKNIKNYGAFVKLPTGIEGLVHVSEMEPGFTASPWEVVEPGEHVHVRIIKIEPHRKRISLSLINA